MIQPLEEFTFEGKTSAFLFARVNHFFESKEIAPDTLVAHEIDGAESAFTEQGYDIITVADNCPDRESGVNILHSSPQTLIR